MPDNRKCKVKYLGQIADHTTPKTNRGGGGVHDECKRLQSPGCCLPSSRKAILAIHEATGKDITLSEKMYCLTVNGGKPGQGYPAILIFTDGRE